MNCFSVLMLDLKTQPSDPVYSMTCQDCVNNTIKSKLKIQHQTACVLDRMEHKVLPPGCKHDSLAPTLYFSRLSPLLCLQASKTPDNSRHELLPLSGNGGKRMSVRGSLTVLLWTATVIHTNWKS